MKCVKRMSKERTFLSIREKIAKKRTKLPKISKQPLLGPTRPSPKQEIQQKPVIVKSILAKRK